MTTISSLQRYHFLSIVLVPLTVFATNCSNPQATENLPAETTDTNGSSEGSSSESTDTLTDSEESSGNTQESTGGTAEESTAGTNEESTEESSDDGPMKLSNGEHCEQDDECESNICSFPIAKDDPLNKRCSECRNAQQCIDEGSGINCTIPANGPFPPYFVCTEGKIGEWCEDNSNCSEGGPYCALLYHDNPRTAVCSWCASNSDCKENEFCYAIPNENMPHLRNEYRECAPPGLLEKDSFCSILEESPHELCEGYCGEISFNGMPIGSHRCGECLPDEGHCPKGTKCEPGRLESAGSNEPPTFIPAACVSVDEETGTETGDSESTSESDGGTTTTDTTSEGTETTASP